MSIQEIVVRLLAALLFAGSVGLQRALTGKAAGMRTHILVGVGSALFTLVSGSAFQTTAANADRIAAQIVSGIGFIGGGAILKERGSVKGLTTAAGLWSAVALGMAAGAGLYAMAAVTTALILGTLIALRRLEMHFPRRALETWAVRLTLDDGATLPPLDDALTHGLAADSGARRGRPDAPGLRGAGAAPLRSGGADGGAARRRGAAHRLAPRRQ